MARKSIRRLAVTLAVANAMFLGNTRDWYPSKELPEDTHPGYYSKGHPRANWKQKERAHNLRVAKRRKKNKAAKKARRKNR